VSDESNGSPAPASPQISFICFAVFDAGELHQSMLEPSLERSIPVDRNRDPYPLAVLAVNMMTAANSQQRPTMTFEEPAEPSARQRLHRLS
jgi:hypothetical protein